MTTDWRPPPVHTTPSKHFGPNAPEAGWTPFMDWLRAQGLEPADVRSVGYFGEDQKAVVHIICRDREGKAYPTLTVDGELEAATKPVIVQCDSPPPLYLRFSKIERGRVERVLNRYREGPPAEVEYPDEEVLWLCHLLEELEELTGTED